MDSLNLAEALATRLCHDFAGPISACGNGVELMGSENDPAMQEQARELLKMSAEAGIARLQFYRTAFGQLKDIAAADTEETRAMAAAYFKQSPIKLDWPEKAGFGGSMPNPHRQALCGMMLFMAGLMAFGGTLSVRQEGQKLLVRGAHKRMKEDAATVAALGSGSTDPLTAYTVVPHFLRLVAEKSGFRLACVKEASPDGIVVELTAEYP